MSHPQTFRLLIDKKQRKKGNTFWGRYGLSTLNVGSARHLLTPAVFNMHSNARCLLSEKGKVLDSANKRMSYCK